MLFPAPKLFGLLFDISLRHFEGKRIIDQVKKGCISFIRQLEEDDEVYLYHPEVFKPLSKRGEQVSALANYDTDGWKFDLMLALKQTLYILGFSEDCDSHKTLCLITDRLNEKQISFLNRIKNINDEDDLNCKLLIIGVGPQTKNAINLIKQDIAKCIHIDNPASINSVLVDYFNSINEV